MRENSLTRSMEDLLTVCSRSIVAPDLIITEAARIITIMNDRSLEQKFIVEGYETLSVLASGFFRSGYDSFHEKYACESGIDHRESGFIGRDELIKYCEFCVAYGDECLDKIKNTLMAQLEIENRMTKHEIFDLNNKSGFSETDLQSITVQNQIIDYIKLSLLVNSLKEFFKEYYKGLN